MKEYPDIPKKGPATQNEQLELSRKASEKTISGIEASEDLKYEDLNAPTLEESDKKFIELSKKLWKEFTVHGFSETDEEGKKVIRPFSDLDGKTAIALFKLAGFDTKNLTYVEQGDLTEDAITVDSGNRHGVVVKGKTMVLDHHTDESGSDLSATKLTYEMLVSMGFLQREPYLDKAVEFVTHIDNKTYPDEEKYFKQSFVTILGLQRYLNPKHLFEFFKTRKSPTDMLDTDELRKYGLLRAAVKQKEVVDQSLKRLKEIERDGFIVESRKYGKIIVDIDKTLPGGYDAAKHSGAGAYIIWNPNSGGFFISGINKPIRDKFSQGFQVRETMWMKPVKDPAPLSITLSEILNTMTDNSLEPQSLLKEYLLREKAPDVKIKEMETSPNRAESFKPILEEWEMKFADDQLSNDELRSRRELLNKIAVSSAPEEDIEEAFADDKITKEELARLRSLLSPKTAEVSQPAEPEPAIHPEESPVEPETPAAPLPEITEDNTAEKETKLRDIDTRIAQINTELSDKVLRWDTVRELKKEREDLWKEKAKLLGKEELPDEEKWSKDQIDRFISYNDRPSNPLGLEKAYWEGLRDKAAQKDKASSEAGGGTAAEAETSAQNEKIEKLKQDIRARQYAISQKHAYLNDQVAKMIEHAQDTGRIPGVGPEGLSYWRNEAVKIEKEIKKLEKELEKLRKELPDGTIVEPVPDIPENQLEPEPEVEAETEPAPEPEATPQPTPEIEIPPTPAGPDLAGETKIKPEMPEPEVRPEPPAQPEAPSAPEEDKEKKSAFKEFVSGLFHKKDREAAASAGIPAIEIQPEAGNKKGSILSWFRERVKSPYRLWAEEITRAMNEFVDKKKEEGVKLNDSKIRKLINSGVDRIKNQLITTRGESRANKILTPERIELIERELEMRLIEMRKGQVVIDTSITAEWLRKNSDKIVWEELSKKIESLFTK